MTSFWLYKAYGTRSEQNFTRPNDYKDNWDWEILSRTSTLLEVGKLVSTIM